MAAVQRTVRTGCTAPACKKILLLAGVNERLNADKPAHPAAAWQINVVGGFQVITEALLVQLGAEPVG